MDPHNILNSQFDIRVIERLGVFLGTGAMANVYMCGGESICKIARRHFAVKFGVSFDPEKLQCQVPPEVTLAETQSEVGQVQAIPCHPNLNQALGIVFVQSTKSYAPVYQYVPNTGSLEFSHLTPKTLGQIIDALQHVEKSGGMVSDLDSTNILIHASTGDPVIIDWAPYPISLGNQREVRERFLRMMRNLHPQGNFKGLIRGKTASWPTIKKRAFAAMGFSEAPEPS